jgi:hypothetical protein
MILFSKWRVRSKKDVGNLLRRLIESFFHPFLIDAEKPRGEKRPPEEILVINGETGEIIVKLFLDEKKGVRFRKSEGYSPIFRKVDEHFFGAGNRFREVEAEAGFLVEISGDFAHLVIQNVFGGAVVAIESRPGIAGRLAKLQYRDVGEFFRLDALEERIGEATLGKIREIILFHVTLFPFCSVPGRFD